jgi:mycothiol synthase
MPLLVPPVPADPTWDLFMRRPHLRQLPQLPPLPAPYHLDMMSAATQEGVAQVLRLSFPEEVWTPERVQRDFVDAPDVLQTFVVLQGESVAATASVRLLPERYPHAGYLHYVGAHPQHQGQRLGYVVALAVLKYFERLECRDAVLETDDFRLPAIKTYLNLGFVPENRHPSHEQRWKDVLAILQQHSH